MSKYPLLARKDEFFPHVGKVLWVLPIGRKGQVFQCVRSKIIVLATRQEQRWCFSDGKEMTSFSNTLEVKGELSRLVKKLWWVRWSKENGKFAETENFNRFLVGSAGVEKMKNGNEVMCQIAPQRGKPLWSRASPSDSHCCRKETIEGRSAN